MAIGKLMTRKQVSSHLQVVRQRKNVNECGAWWINDERHVPAVLTLAPFPQLNGW
jgi:hypothetical protein